MVAIPTESRVLYYRISPVYKIGLSLKEETVQTKEWKNNYWYELKLMNLMRANKHELGSLTINQGNFGYYEVKRIISMTDWITTDN